jgi:hypothetical protein
MRSPLTQCVQGPANWARNCSTCTQRKPLLSYLTEQVIVKGYSLRGENMFSQKLLNHRLDPGGRDRSRQSDKSKAFKINSIDVDPSAWLTRNNWRSDPKLGSDRELRREMQV